MKLLNFLLPSIISCSTGSLVTFYDNTIVSQTYKEKYTIGDLVIYHFDLDYSPSDWDSNVMDMDLDHDVYMYDGLLTATTEAKIIWNLDRIAHRRPSRNKNYEYDPKYTGKDQVAYVVDSGIDTKHPEFEGRAFLGIDVTGDASCLNNHGTHVAGTIGSRTYGVATSSKLVDVRVLNCKGSGSYSGVIRGLEWVAKQLKKGPVNMSLGGPKSKVVNKALDELSKKGFYVVVAAGNENQDACDVSPASASSAISVGATKSDDTFATFSNWGKCVSILAPGVGVLSTVPGNKVASLSGTSMASPHVAGVVALHLEQYGEVSLHMMNKLLTGHSSKDYIRRLKENTINNLLYSSY